MDTRRLEAFVKVVDLGSVTRAAKLLHVAQPALSQQILALEAEFKRSLLIRSTRGVTPTDAGRILYRYAQSIGRQLDEARRNILENKQELTGNVTVGLAPFSSASLLAGPLLTEVRKSHPGIILRVFDSFGTTLSELMLKGALDMAVLYESAPVQGLHYTPLMIEEFFLVAPRDMLDAATTAAEVGPADLASFDLIVPPQESFLRRAIERVCAEAGLRPRIVAEVQSRSTLSSAMQAGLGATVLPRTIAEALAHRDELVVRRIASPAAALQMSLCISDHAGLSDAAFAVYGILSHVIARTLQGPVG